MIFLDFGKITKKDGEIFVLGKFCERVRKDTEISSCRGRRTRFFKFDAYKLEKGNIAAYQKQQTVERLASEGEATFLCGRFEGIDERVLEAYPFEEVSLGDFVLSGGEPAALAVLESGKK